MHLFCTCKLKLKQLSRAGGFWNGNYLRETNLCLSAYSNVFFLLFLLFLLFLMSFFPPVLSQELNCWQSKWVKGKITTQKLNTQLRHYNLSLHFSFNTIYCRQTYTEGLMSWDTNKVYSLTIVFNLERLHTTAPAVLCELLRCWKRESNLSFRRNNVFLSSEHTTL